MRIRRSRKTTVIASLLVLAVAGAAYAYWTAGGTGTGTAETGETLPLTANQVTVLDPMYPGDSPQTISGTFDNPNDGPTYVTSVTAAITGVSGGDGACTDADYLLDNEVMLVGAEVPAGTGGAWTGATIQFNNTGANQDGCKNATVTLTYTIV
ncbi:MAG TPA: hypothetical protein VFV09_07875 [Actinomycetota bacterium]|jgi:hypothetical protein|nr:hypothetical protein [Actinomycetota bacterium]